MTQPDDFPFHVAPEEERLSGVGADGGRRQIEPILSKGRWWRARAAVAGGLIALFLALPWLTVAGKPAVLLDVAARRFTVLGVTLHPTDNLILLVFGAGLIVTLFFVTAVLGRLWCGWACPQTVYLEFVFRRVESWIEGGAGERRRRDAGPWTVDRAWRKGLKWLVFAALCAGLAATFAAYFVGTGGVLAAAADPGVHGGTVAAVGIVAALGFVDFAFFREQMCTTACPYGRLQNVLYDADTVLVGYDGGRGEPRAKPRDRTEGSAAGDCIDCRACVATCPTGIDIRRGLQMECVGCTQCVDACDAVMARTKRPLGLVRYTSLRELAGGGRRFVRPRVFVYGAVLVAVYAAFWLLLAGRAPASAEVLRASSEPFRVLPGGLVSTQVRVRVTNQMDAAQAVTVRLLAPEGAELAAGSMPLVVAPGSVETLQGAIKAPRSAFLRGRATARFRIESDAGLAVERELVILGPEGPGR